MVPELHIAKLDPGGYELHVLNGGVEIATPSIFASISEALQQVGERFPQSWSSYIDVHYLDVSIGTQALALLKTDPEVLAARLVALAAEVWESEGALRTSADGIEGTSLVAKTIPAQTA